MNKRDVIEQFRMEHMNDILREEESDGGGINYSLREKYWDDFIEYLNRCGEVSDNQLETWSSPFTYRQPISTVDHV